eukprot:TRINITY_DN10650_c0_g2_i3.p1 TRINITY_DN10650_c0_g2~~TRINITY_DN10650_c0_g2_i3.p1  ORF type:complete len:317 (+),score=58.16 TRINITY_DN10650_c0_g2_i3:42-992(+)
MKLLMFRSLWGAVKQFDGPHTVEAAVKAFAALGYDGIEVPYKLVLDVGRQRFRDILSDNNMKVGFQIFTDGPVIPGVAGVAGGPFAGHPSPGESPQEHYEVFREQVRGAMEYDPVFVDSHSGKDYFTVDQADEFFQQAIELQKTEAEGLLLMHETHRKRYLHSPWVARDFVPRYPDLKLCADLSHFINIAETDCQDPVLNDVIHSLAPQVYHIHARVGYDHGPQVNDPRAPEWKEYLEGHEAWWDAIWDAQEARGQERTTLCPEHGPPNYQQTLPYTRQPVADIAEVNHFIALRQQKRFGKKFGLRNTSECKSALI